MIKSTITGINELKNELNKIVKSLDAPMVTVGYHEDAIDPPEGEITMATLAAVHEFGADIKHPGGTNYGYASKDAASKGQVRFMKKGEGYAVLGQTKPHDIKIPARPSLEPGFNSGLKDYEEIMAEGIDATVTEGVDINKALNQVGVLAVGKVQEYMTNVKAPANSPATIKKKGSSNPLIDTGAMRSAVNYKLRVQKPEEGL